MTTDHSASPTPHLSLKLGSVAPLFNEPKDEASQSQTSPSSSTHTEHEKGGSQHQTPTCPVPLVTFPLFLVESLGGLLHNRLVERLEGHMEDAIVLNLQRRHKQPGKYLCLGTDCAAE